MKFFGRTRPTQAARRHRATLAVLAAGVCIVMILGVACGGRGVSRNRHSNAYTDHYSRPYRSPDRGAYRNSHGHAGASRRRADANAHSDSIARSNANPHTYNGSYSTASYTDPGTPGGGSPHGAEAPGLVI